MWIRRKLRIWFHLLKKSLMENFIFCAVSTPTTHSAQPKLFLIFLNKLCLFDRDSIVAKMFNLDRINIARFFNFYSKWLLLCLKLFKYKPHHNVHSECLDTVALKFDWQVVSVRTQRKKSQNSQSRKGSQAELMRVPLCKLHYKIFREFWDNNKFSKILHIFYIIFRKAYIFFSILHEIFPLSYCLMVWLWL